MELRLRKHTVSMGSLDDDQEGFCAGRSTVRYLFRLLANITEIKRQQLNCIILFIDFERAVDSVYIPLLVLKLEKLNIK